MNIKPLHDRIAVREIKPPEFSTGGIFLGVQDDSGFVKAIVTGVVLAVGPGLKNARGKRESMWGIRPGDVVQYSPVCSHTETLDGGEVTLIRREAVVGVAQ